MAPAGTALAASPAPIITAFAGSGTAGAVTPGPATASRLGSPQGVAVDAAGDVLIADAADNQVLRVTPAGTLSVIAGTGTAGAPTPGPATGSALNHPQGVAVDAAGDILIADTGNHMVERVTPAGALSVLAGDGTSGTPVPGPATASPLSSPSGLALDAAGDLYIADGGSYVVEEVAPDGTLSIFAGNGTHALPHAATPATGTPLDAPAGVAVDAAGNLYVADSAANEVEKVTAAGALTLFAGKSAGTAGAPTAGTATNSKLSAPAAVAVDAAGNVYVADSANNRVEEITPGDRLSTLAGNGVAAAPTLGVPATLSALNAPAGVAVSAAGLVYVADTHNATAERVAAPPPAVTVAPAVTGTATQGQTLSAGNGSWSSSPTSFAYAWQRCDAAGNNCAAVAGATASTFALSAADVAHTLRVRVTATNASGTGAPATSAASSAVLPLPPANTAAPVIGGSLTNTMTLSVSPGVWSNSPTSFSYAWQRCDGQGGGCADISGATSATYTLTADDVAGTVRVVVTARNAGGSATHDSAVSAVIAPVVTPWANVAVPALLTRPAVSGATAPGATLTCSPGTWSGSAQFRYQWNRGTQPLDGATAATYTVTAADRGHDLSCSVIASNAGGDIQADSAALGIPAAACPAPSGALGGSALGPVALGETRGQARAALPSRTGAAKNADTFCLTGGGGIRAAYAPTKLVASIARAHRGQVSGRLVLALTSNPYYTIAGIHPGTRMADLPQADKLGRPLHVGRLNWYVLPVSGAVSGLVAGRGGVVREVGIADRRLTRGRAAQTRLLRSLGA